MKRRLSTPIETLRIRARQSAARVEAARLALLQAEHRATADAERVELALANRAQRDAERRMRGQS